MAEKQDETQPAILIPTQGNIQYGVHMDSMHDMPIDEIDELLINGPLHHEKLELENAYKKCKVSDLNILIAGATGSGKSTLANAIAGDNVFKIGENLDRCSQNVIPKKDKHHVVRIWDSPGLFDDSGNDKKYLKEIGTVLKYFQDGDVIVFCIQAKTRFTIGKENQDLKILQKMKKEFDAKIFKKHMVIALTFADTIRLRFFDSDPDEGYRTTIADFKQKIAEGLEKIVKLDAETAHNIKIIPMQHHRNPIPLPGDTEGGLTSFWSGCSNVSPSLNGMAKWIVLFKDNIVDAPDSDPAIARRQVVLSDNFYPEVLLQIKSRYQARGGNIGMLGFLGGPLALLTIPMGVWAGAKYGEKKYIEESLKKETAEAKATPATENSL